MTTGSGRCVRRLIARILRLAEDGDVIMVSSSVTESRPSTPRGPRTEMTAGDGGFGSSGVMTFLFRPDA